MSAPDTAGAADSEDRLRAVLAEVWSEITAYACRRLPGDPGWAQEFVQEAAVDLMRRWRQRGEVSATTAVAMMKQAVKRDVQNLWSRQERQRTDLVAVDDQVLLDHLDRGVDHEEEIFALISRIDAECRGPQLLALLTDQQRAAIVAVHVDGATHAQAAADLGVTERAVQARLKNALDLLRRHLAQPIANPTVKPSAQQMRGRTQR